MSSVPTDRTRGLELLTQFGEPKETRLGYAVAGFAGHGGADGVGASIWNALTTDLQALLRIGVFTQIEDLPAFIEGVAEDFTSDITTRIIFEPLSNFTASMVADYKQFTAGRHRVQLVDRQVWNPSILQWEQKQLTLPVADGKPLLLVPLHWPRSNLLMSASRFYEVTVLGYAQEEQTVISKQTGKPLKPTKDALKAQLALTRSRATILDVTDRALNLNQVNLLQRFRDFVDSKYQPLSDDRIERKLET